MSSKRKNKTPNIWKERLKELIKFANSKGWTIIISKKRGEYDAAYLGTNKIILNGIRKPEITFYFGLHEIGHLLIYANTKLNKQYSTKHHPSTQIYKILKLEEEILAWNKGEKLAKKLGLPIIDKNFLKLKSHCIATYAKWITKAAAKKKQNSVNKKLKDAEKALNVVPLTNP